MTTMKLSNALLDVYVAPASLFDAIKQGTRPLIPLLLMLAISFVGVVYFYSNMSTEWIVEQQMLQAGDMSPAEEERIRAYFAESAGYIGWIGAVTQLVATLIITAVFALYFRIVGHKAEDFTYGNWFGFTVWTQMPTVILMLGFFAILFTASTPDLPIMTLGYASLNQLALGLSPGDAFYNWAEALNLFFLWSIVLSAVGLQRWVGMNMAKAAFFAALPYLLVFGIWAAMV